MKVCIDFDGVLNNYCGWKGPDFLYEPREGVLDFLFDLKQYADEIVIFTARDTGKVQEWLDKYELAHYFDDVTNVKVPADVYLDDRGVQFNGNFEDAMHEILSFRVHWQGQRE